MRSFQDQLGVGCSGTNDPDQWVRDFQSSAALAAASARENAALAPPVMDDGKRRRKPCGECGRPVFMATIPDAVDVAIDADPVTSGPWGISHTSAREIVMFNVDAEPNMSAQEKADEPRFIVHRCPGSSALAHPAYTQDDLDADMDTLRAAGYEP